MSISDIGFYTLTDERAKLKHFNLERCEIILTEFCNFKCPYCKGVEAYSRDCSGHMDYDIAKSVLLSWFNDGLKNIRFSGGEPTMYPQLGVLVDLCADNNVERIAISSNGSMPWQVYSKLIRLGVNDFSISLDACCASDAKEMAGGKDVFDTVVSNIKWLSEVTYVTAGIVLTNETQSTVADVVKLAHDLGVSDIRIITAVQYNGEITKLDQVPQDILDAHPILKYRVGNLLAGGSVRGISDIDTNKCYLVRDDSVVAGKWHFPCVIHMREGGEPIGEVGDNMMAERYEWSLRHNTHLDTICKENCLDCLVDYNNLAFTLD